MEHIDAPAWAFRQTIFQILTALLEKRTPFFHLALLRTHESDFSGVRIIMRFGHRKSRIVANPNMPTHHSRGRAQAGKLRFVASPHISQML